jgi:hypothetical protein
MVMVNKKANDKTHLQVLSAWWKNSFVTFCFYWWIMLQGLQYFLGQWRQTVSKELWIVQSRKKEIKKKEMRSESRNNKIIFLLCFMLEGINIDMNRVLVGSLVTEERAFLHA